MNKHERCDLIDEAKDHLEQAYDLVAKAIKGTPCESNVKAYWLDHLKIMTSEDHGFLTRDTNLDSVKEMLQEDEEENDEEEEEEERDDLDNDNYIDPEMGAHG